VWGDEVLGLAGLGGILLFYLYLIGWGLLGLGWVVVLFFIFPRLYIFTG